jgi:LPS-assembly protein
MLALLAHLGAASALAQAPAGAGSPPAQPPAGAKGKPASPPAADAGEIHLRAETQEVVEKGHFRAAGFVDLTTGSLHLQADQMDIYEEPGPAGAIGHRVVAVGNVVFLREEERISGERLEMNLETGQGTFTQAVGYVQPGVFVEARQIERLDADTYRLEGANFSACSQPNPRWCFDAALARIQLDDKLVAHNVVFRVKSVPAFYLPYIYYPLHKDERSTGFLLPHVGYSSIKGFDIGIGFFWAMGRSFDQTFYLDRYSIFGYGYGHEFRYAADAASHGTFRSFAIRPEGSDIWDYDLDWNAVQALPGQFRATVQVRRYSNQAFQQNTQETLNQATIRNRRSAFSVQRNFGSTVLQLTADDTDTFFGETTRVNRHLPTLRLARFPRKVGRTPLVFGFEARAERLAFGDEIKANEFTRYSVAPELSIPLAVSFLQITPRAKVSLTHYGASVIDPTERRPDLSGPPLARRFFEGGVELVGPTFSRIFDNPSHWYSDKFKHVIGPQIVFQYRTAVTDFDYIPKFDGEDQYLGTNQVQYSLVQRLLARRPGPGGKPQSYEFLNWTISQTYYVQIRDKQNEFDPNYSSSAFGPGGVPDHNSPILSRVRLRPVPAFSTTFDLEYDVNYKQLRRLGLSTVFNAPGVMLQAGWTQAQRLAVLQANRQVTVNTLRGSGRLDLWGGLQAQGSVDYDYVLGNLLHSSVKLHWGLQCLGLAVEMIQYEYNQRQERQFRFSLELAHIGSMGSFSGADARAGSTGGTYLGP